MENQLSREFSVVYAIVAFVLQQSIEKWYSQNIRKSCSPLAALQLTITDISPLLRVPMLLILQRNISAGILCQYNGILRQCSVGDLCRLVHCIYKIKTKSKV